MTSIADGSAAGGVGSGYILRRSRLRSECGIRNPAVMQRLPPSRGEAVVKIAVGIDISVRRALLAHVSCTAASGDIFGSASISCTIW